jgi:hypothetical protein
LTRPPAGADDRFATGAGAPWADQHAGSNTFLQEVRMPSGLFMPALEALDPETLPISMAHGVSRGAAEEMAKAAPSNQAVVDACISAYQQHIPAIDNTTVGSVNSATAPGLQPDIDALHAFDWNRQVPAPQLASPVYASETMDDARSAIADDGAFMTFFVGIEASADVIIGGCGGVGVGLGFPWTANSSALWMAYGGLRIALNIDVAVNLNCGVFLEPPSEVAGDYLGIDVSAEPIEEGPSIGFGIHLSRDLSKIRGFSLAVGVELGVLPVTAAVVFGNIKTAQASRPGYGVRPVDHPSVAPAPVVRQMGAMG